MTQPDTFEVTITHLDNINFTTIITTQDAQITEDKILYTPVTNPIYVTGSKFNYICKAIKSSILVISKLNNQLILSSGIGGIIDEKIIIGECEQSLDIFYNDFESENFTRLGKLGSFVTQPIEIFAEVDKLIIGGKSNIGFVYIHIYKLIE